MNFGKWIVVAYVLFGAFIGTLVTVCVKQDVTLVSKNYYNDELDYQNQITRINNARTLIKKPTIVNAGNSIQVAFDESFSVAKGELKLFCPSNPASDRSFSLSLDAHNSQYFDINEIKSGMYKAKLLWTMEGKDYFIEQVIYI